MAQQVGFSGLYYPGWLLATINLSDLAAMGATPIGLLTSLILPRDTTIEQFEGLLDGLDECASLHGTRVLGGNLKEDKTLSLTATAVGLCEYRKLSRAGARPGDVVFIIGTPGTFWAAVLAYRNGLIDAGSSLSPLLASVAKPRAMIAEGVECAKSELVTALMDSSDGLYPTLGELARQSSTSIRVDFDQFNFHPAPPLVSVANKLSVDPARFVLGWGDWVLVGTAQRDRFAELERRIQGIHGHIIRIGTVIDKQPLPVVAIYQGQEGRLMPLDSERFAPDSWFAAGIDGYIDRLLHEAIVD